MEKIIHLKKFLVVFYQFLIHGLLVLQFLEFQKNFLIMNLTIFTKFMKDKSY